MQVAVWDTFVKRGDGRTMHFDIIAPAEIKDAAVIYGYGRDYLKEKGEDSQTLTSNECSFCHVDEVQPQWVKAIEEKGYFIYEMENCD
ncbi:MAG: DUF2024 family protein [Acidobacteriota bacterium]|nr:MAG: DUF2024 family protein [Acidobacteriota bacterium]